MCLNGYQYTIRRSQGVNGQHSQGGHTVQQDEVIRLADFVQHLPQNCFPAHHVHHGRFQTSQFNAGREKIYAFLLVQDTFILRNGFIQDNFLH